MPLSMAAEYTMGLNDDPGWRKDWVARLNWLFSKEKPPTQARTSPGRGSMDTMAPSIRGSSCMASFHMVREGLAWAFSGSFSRLLAFRPGLATAGSAVAGSGAFLSGAANTEAQIRSPASTLPLAQPISSGGI